MKIQGIRISDTRNSVLDVTLINILEEILNGSLLNWCILFLDGMPKPEEGNLLRECHQINKSENGFRVHWDELISIGSRFFQIYEATIFGCEQLELVHRYESDQELYQSCDIVIELIDCAFWEVYAKDQRLIDRLKNKFKETKLLPDDIPMGENDL